MGHKLYDDSLGNSHKIARQIKQSAGLAPSLKIFVCPIAFCYAEIIGRLRATMG
jgi:hypothetical protein